MIHINRNKNELLVLTGAVYSFIAYLTAFTLEVLFLIDLARRSNEILTAAASSSSPNQALDDDLIRSSASNSSLPPLLAVGLGGSAADTNLPFDRLTFESIQAHITISCLAVSILYFLLFIASLVLIVALIMHSTFILLIWMCIQTTMYLPEFGLIVYVSVYGWGIGTRNGQAELVFYSFRAILNVLFILRAHKLFKDWNYEKNFFRYKSGSHFSGFDSPYFIGGGIDSSTTTINPVFSSSTLNLNRYDQVRASSLSPLNNSIYSDFDIHHQSPHQDHSTSNSRGRLAAAGISREMASKLGAKFKASYDFDNEPSPSSATTMNKQRNTFYLGNDDIINGRSEISREQTETRRPLPTGQQVAACGRLPTRPSSLLSINDDFADYELDLDYRTLSQQQKGRHRHNNRDHTSYENYCNRNEAHGYNNNNNNNDAIAAAAAQMTKSPDGASYSTQSLDRRHLRDFCLPEHVILRPLGHQPFDYLHRPGSSSNLNNQTTSNLNTQPGIYSSHTRLTKRSDYDLNNDKYRF